MYRYTDFDQRIVDGGQRNARQQRDADDGDAAKHRAMIAPLVAVGAPALDQSLGLIEVQRRNRHAAPLGGFADRERDLGGGVGHLRNLAKMVGYSVSKQSA